MKEYTKKDLLNILQENPVDVGQKCFDPQLKKLR